MFQDSLQIRRSFVYLISCVRISRNSEEMVKMKNGNKKIHESYRGFLVLFFPFSRSVPCFLEMNTSKTTKENSKLFIKKSARKIHLQVRHYALISAD